MGRLNHFIGLAGSSFTKAFGRILVVTISITEQQPML